jgi:ribonuclease HI
MAKKKKYYVVWNGVKPGIYDDWSTCLQQIKGYPDAKYKSFKTRAEAAAAYKDSPSNHYGQKAQKTKKLSAVPPELIAGTIAVDAACSGNPGIMEYRGVWTETGQEIFKRGPYEHATNNIGEFLAIVHALAALKQQGADTTIWTDSRTALAWVRNKKVKTSLKRLPKNEVIFDLIERAITWLERNTYNNELKKWKTDTWGEIPADFGRK